MAVAATVTLEEYLSTSYDPDREYVDGRLIERNVGELNHGLLQLILGMALKAQGLRSYVETRFQVRTNRFRIPDVMALAPGQRRARHYQVETPYIVIEIISPDDRMGDLRTKLRDYFDAGVPNIWVVDPRAQTLTVHEPSRARTVSDRVETADGTVSIDVADLFRQLDEDKA